MRTIRDDLRRKRHDIVRLYLKPIIHNVFMTPKLRAGRLAVRRQADAAGTADAAASRCSGMLSNG